mgnify:CR=1 FL=1
MNKVGLGIAVVGIVVCLIGAVLFAVGGDGFGSLEESRQYEGRDGEMKLEGYAELNQILSLKHWTDADFKRMLIACDPPLALGGLGQDHCRAWAILMDPYRAWEEVIGFCHF